MSTNTFIICILLCTGNFKKLFVYGDGKRNEMTLVDFTTLQTLQGWMEISDVIRPVGKSKAVLSLQKTHQFQRAVLFTMLNPQPDGAGFAGFRLKTEFNLTAYHSLQLLCRGQGDYYGYKAVLRHNREPFPLFEHMFQAPFRKFGLVKLHLSHFEPYHRGRRQVNSPPLNTANITSLELHVYGGVYLPVKQSGTASLEIDWIKLSISSRTQLTISRMKKYSVSLDLWKMFVTFTSYIALAFTAWVFLRLVNACFWLPTFLTKYQNKELTQDFPQKREEEDQKKK